MAAKADAQKAKLEALERKLGIDPNVKNGESSGSGAPEVFAGKKHRFEDSEYIEQTKELSENVKSAVSAAFLKKRKKAKVNHTPPSDSAASKPDGTDSSEKAKDKTDSKAPIPAIVATPLALDVIGA